MSKLIVKQMNREDLRETCSLVKVYYYLLNDFLQQTAVDVGHETMGMGMGRAEFVKKCMMLARK